MYNVKYKKLFLKATSDLVVILVHGTLFFSQLQQCRFWCSRKFCNK
jgi:hypothetical protein